MVTNIRLATPADEEQLAPLRRSLWPDWKPGESPSTLPCAVFVAEEESGVLIGFLEAGLRSHADGCDPAHPVGFVEGWLVKEEMRGQGIGQRLLEAAEDWARAQGCTEMASDTWIDNELSQRVHEALGFQVVDRCVHYRKAL
ncbi:MAG TPA: GNAT family N-acetyltransferase [Bryobacteraceae bacterium]|jgi:aminoglycoside 6'-N-acetyltransferase I|nr:GNAT family N-acetyltransferase [Bryobacteraceae bacterium]